MDITIRKGETLQVPVVNDDNSAVSVQFEVAKGGVTYIDLTENFEIVDKRAEATLITNNTDLEVGEYSYMLTVTYSDGSIDKLPDIDECGEDCTLPKFIVCLGNPSEVS